MDLLDGAEAVILIDAVRSGALSGTIHEFSIDEVDRRAARFVSSHDLGVAAAIQLARKLGRGPFVGRVIGIEIAPGSTAQLSSADSAPERAKRCAERSNRCDRRPSNWMLGSASASGTRELRPSTLTLGTRSTRTRVTVCSNSSRFRTGPMTSIAPK